MNPALAAVLIADLVCTSLGHSMYSFNAQLDLRTNVLTDSRTEGSSEPLDFSKREVVDSRCGKIGWAPADHLNYEVTPKHWWGQDIVQLPKSAAANPNGASFQANMHACAYDGGWSASEDVLLRCTLTARR
ncbi:MAG: hypothetical protein HY925_00275 [Elusimicrobia bacterium]|nr:hypothetical protein [Elusimicrobiota bacterium]